MFSRRTVLACSALALTACTIQRWQPAPVASVEDHSAHMVAADLRAPFAAARAAQPHRE